MTPQSRFPRPTAGSPRQTRPDAGARRAAKKVRALKATAKKLPAVVLDSGRIATMGTRELLATLEEVVRAEKLYLSRSKDPRPILVDKPTEGGFKMVFRLFPPGTDPVALFETLAKRLGIGASSVQQAILARPGIDTVTRIRDLAKQLGKDPATVLQGMEFLNPPPNKPSNRAPR